MKWYHRIGISVIDLLIVVVMLWGISLAVAPMEGLLYFVTTDGMTIAAITFGIYIGLAIFAEVLVMTGGMAGDAWFAKLARGAITTIIVMLGFPWLIKRVFWFMGLMVGADVENILFYAAFIRFAVRYILGRRWK